MIIKKFLDKDSRSVLSQVRKEFGAEAIVLSSKSVGEQFEMIAATDYREAELQQEFQRRGTNSYEVQAAREVDDSSNAPTLDSLHAELVALREMLQSETAQQKKAPTQAQTSSSLRADSNRYQIETYIEHLELSGAMRNSLKRRLKASDSVEDVPKKTLRLLSRALPEADLKGFSRTGVALALGGPGCGKTTALLKLAERHRQAHGAKSIGLIHYSHKKLSVSPFNAYGRKIKSKMVQVSTPRRLASAMRSLASKKLVLIDCDSEILASAELANILNALPEATEKFLVLAANEQVDQLNADIKQFRKYASSVVISKYDKPLHLSGLAELLIRYKLPLAFRSDGERISVPILGANSHALIRKAFNLAEMAASVEDVSVNRRLA